jgi:glycosyltransferase involved in cell wall biosynthesis
VKPLIAIPTFNEAGNIQSVLQSLKPFTYDVLIVDDGSTDATPDILATLEGVRVLRHDPNQGYGKSLIDAFDYAAREGFDWVITMDADGQHEADSIPDFISQMESGAWDLVSGSRYLNTGSADDLPPPERRNINHRVTTILNNVFGMELTDSFCGFKAHRVSAMQSLNLDEAGYAFPLQLWPRVWEHKLRMKEIAVRRIYNDPNRTFGNGLDDANRRFNHYVDVLNRELVRMGHPPVEPDAVQRQPIQPSARLGCGCRG